MLYMWNIHMNKKRTHMRASIKLETRPYSRPRRRRIFLELCHTMPYCCCGRNRVRSVFGTSLMCATIPYLWLALAQAGADIRA